MQNEVKICPRCKIELSPADWPDGTPCPVCGMEYAAPPEEAAPVLDEPPRRANRRTTPLTKLLIWTCVLAALGGVYVYKFGVPFADAPPLTLEEQCAGWREALESSIRKSNDEAVTAASILAKDNAASSEYQDVQALIETYRQEQNALSAKLKACPEKYRQDLPETP